MPFIDSWFHVRAERNRLLRNSDWTQLLDAPLTPVQQLQWKIYRQKLRDLPVNQSTVDPKDVVFSKDPNNKKWNRTTQRLE